MLNLSTKFGTSQRYSFVVVDKWSASVGHQIEIELGAATRVSLGLPSAEESAAFGWHPHLPSNIVRSISFERLILPVEVSLDVYISNALQ